MISSLIKYFLKIEIQLNMSEQEQKQQRIYDLLNTETKLNFIVLHYTKKIIFSL